VRTSHVPVKEWGALARKEEAKVKKKRDREAAIAEGVQDGLAERRDEEGPSDRMLQGIRQGRAK